MTKEKSIIEKVEQYRYITDFDKTIYVETFLHFYENGQLINVVQKNERTSYAPNADIASLPEHVQPRAALEWTEDVVAAYKERIAQALPPAAQG